MKNQERLPSSNQTLNRLALLVAMFRVIKESDPFNGSSLSLNFENECDQSCDVIYESSDW